MQLDALASSCIVCVSLARNALKTVWVQLNHLFLDHVKANHTYHAWQVGLRLIKEE